MPDTPLDVVACCDRMGRELAQLSTRPDALDAVSGLAATTVPGAEGASVTERRAERLVTVAATDDAARAADAVQYAAAGGPCVDALAHTAGPAVPGTWPATAAGRP